MLENIEEIHESLVNGQRRQCVKMIDEFGLYDFWDQYADYLVDLYTSPDSRWRYFTDMAISYHRIKNR